MLEPFELKVRQQLEPLQRQDYLTIEAQITQKRLVWLEKNYPVQKALAPLSPRQAFELLFFDYMGLSVGDLPVVQENDREIIWLSKNPCPTLAACLRLDMDTRMVCRLINEKSTQAFLSYLDPQLQFVRSYKEIRPYAPYCRESIVRVNPGQNSDG